MRRDLSFIFGYVVRFDMNFIYKKLLVLNFKESVLISRQNEFWTIFELLIFTKQISLWDDRSRQREDIIPWFRWQWKAMIKLNGLNHDTCLLCYTLLQRNNLKVVFFQKMRFGAHSSDPLVSQLQGSGMCHILNGSYLS